MRADRKRFTAAASTGGVRCGALGGTWDVERRLLRDPRQRSVVVRPADLQRLTLEDDAVEGHGLRGLVHRAELKRKHQLQRRRLKERQRESQDAVVPPGRRSSCPG